MTTTIQESRKIEIDTESDWTNVTIDSQFLSTYMSCPAKYNYVFNRHLIPIRGMSKSIQKGLLTHDAVNAYYKVIIEGKDYQEASKAGVEKAKENCTKYENLEPEDSLEVFQTLIEFFKHISNSFWIPLFAEQYFKKVVYQDDKLRLRIILTGRIDLAFRTPQIPLLPVDIKTESERWFHSQMSNQFKIYCIACGVNLLGVQRIGFQKSLKNEEKFKMEMIPYDPDILEEFRTVTLPYYAKQMLLSYEDNYWPMNTASCISGHFACQFSDKYDGGICNVSRNVREQKLARWFKVGEEWDPRNV